MTRAHGEGENMANINGSILDTIKQMLGSNTDTTFDVDIIIGINSAISRLTQLGVGVSEGYEIQDSTNTWTDFLDGDKRFSFVKSYIYLKTKLIFDPPVNSAILESMNNQIKELEWCICNANDINPL